VFSSDFAVRLRREITILRGLTKEVFIEKLLTVQ